MKPGKPDKIVSAALRQATKGNANDPGRPPLGTKRLGTNRGITSGAVKNIQVTTRKG